MLYKVNNLYLCKTQIYAHRGHAQLTTGLFYDMLFLLGSPDGIPVFAPEKRNNPWPPFFRTSQPRVISLHYYYLTSLVNLAFCSLTVALPDPSLFSSTTYLRFFVLKFLEARTSFCRNPFSTVGSSVDSWLWVFRFLPVHWYHPFWL